MGINFGSGKFERNLYFTLYNNVIAFDAIFSFFQRMPLVFCFLLVLTIYHQVRPVKPVSRPLIGGSLCHMTILRKWQCCISLPLRIPLVLKLRNSYVPCHYLFGPHVTVTKVYVAPSKLRNGHVTLSISIRGQGPYSP